MTGAARGGSGSPWVRGAIASLLIVTALLLTRPSPTTRTTGANDAAQRIGPASSPTATP